MIPVVLSCLVLSVLGVQQHRQNNLNEISEYLQPAINAVNMECSKDAPNLEVVTQWAAQLIQLSTISALEDGFILQPKNIPFSISYPISLLLKQSFADNPKFDQCYMKSGSYLDISDESKFLTIEDQQKDEDEVLMYDYEVDIAAVWNALINNQDCLFAVVEGLISAARNCDDKKESMFMHALKNQLVSSY